MKELDFQKNKVEVMTLDELSQTYRENYPNGLPVGGMYHFALIQQILESFERYNLKYEVKEVFAGSAEVSPKQSLPSLSLQLRITYATGVVPITTGTSAVAEQACA